MRETLIAILALFAAVLMAASAEPLSLVCDPYLAGDWQPESFVYQTETGKDAQGESIWADERVTPAVTCPEIEGSVRLHLDISAWPKGLTTLRIKARKIILPLTIEESEFTPPFPLSKDNTQKVPGAFGFAE